MLLSAHPQGMVVGEIQTELAIPNSTLSHHLEKLKHEDLVRVRRDSTFLGFLYAECCTRNKAVKPNAITSNCSNRTATARKRPQS